MRVTSYQGTNAPCAIMCAGFHENIKIFPTLKSSKAIDVTRRVAHTKILISLAKGTACVAAWMSFYMATRDFRFRVGITSFQACREPLFLTKSSYAFVRCFVWCTLVSKWSFQYQALKINTLQVKLGGTHWNADGRMKNLCWPHLSQFHCPQALSSGFSRSPMQLSSACDI